MCWAISTAVAARSRARRSAVASQVIRAHVPLAEMFGYVNELRSMTSGRASYSMEFSHYAEVPKNLAEEIKAKSSGKACDSNRPERSERIRSGETREHGEAEVCAEQAACERGDDRAHRPRQDDADRGDHQGAGAGAAGRPSTPPLTRSTKRPRNASAASPSPSPTSSTRPRSGTTPTSTAPDTPTTSRT